MAGHGDPNRFDRPVILVREKSHNLRRARYWIFRQVSRFRLAARAGTGGIIPLPSTRSRRDGRVDPRTLIHKGLIFRASTPGFGGSTWHSATSDFTAVEKAVLLQHGHETRQG